jgi:hypothetical protein
MRRVTAPTHGKAGRSAPGLLHPVRQRDRRARVEHLLHIPEPRTLPSGLKPTAYFTTISLSLTILSAGQGTVNNTRMVLAATGANFSSGSS